MLNKEESGHTARPLLLTTPRRATRIMSTPRRRHGGRALMMLAALLASALTAASAQNDEYMAEQQQVHVSTAMIALLAAVIAVFLFIAFSTVYLRHCTSGYAVRSDVDDGRAVALDRSFFMISRRHQRRPRGLDAGVVAAFPTMRYAEAKALRVGTKGGGGNMALECAVCLSEFEDEERLTLLPRCSHAFHPDCIGEWLAGHVTCPVCRCNLDPNCYKDTSSDEEPMMMGFPQANSVSSEVTSLRQDDGAAQPPVAAVVIDVVTEEEEEERVREAMELQQIGNQRRAMRSRSGRRTPVLARSHSTGRSLAVRLDRDMERFTLRLPEHVRREMVAAAGEQSRRGQRSGAAEGSCSRGGRSGPLAGRAARWQSLIVRTFSGKVSLFSASRSAFSSDGGGEVSSSSSSRVRGKRVASVDAAGVPVKGSILRFDRIGGSPSGAKAGTAPAGDEEKAVTQQVRT